MLTPGKKLSTFIETEGASETYVYADIDSSRTIRYISLLVNGGIAYEGIRLYDEEMDYILNLEEGASRWSKWTEVQEIPEGR